MVVGPREGASKSACDSKSSRCFPVKQRAPQRNSKPGSIGSLGKYWNVGSNKQLPFGDGLNPTHKDGSIGANLLLGLPHQMNMYDLKCASFASHWRMNDHACGLMSSDSYTI